MKEECLLSALALNLKRMVKALDKPFYMCKISLFRLFALNSSALVGGSPFNIFAFSHFPFVSVKYDSCGIGHLKFMLDVIAH